MDSRRVKEENAGCKFQIGLGIRQTRGFVNLPLGERQTQRIAGRARTCKNIKCYLYVRLTQRVGIDGIEVDGLYSNRWSFEVIASGCLEKYTKARLRWALFGVGEHSFHRGSLWIDHLLFDCESRCFDLHGVPGISDCLPPLCPLRLVKRGGPHSDPGPDTGRDTGPMR